MRESLSLKRRAYSYTLTAFIWLCVLLAVSLLVYIVGFVFFRGAGHVNWLLLSTARSALRNTIGILPNIIFTLYVVFTTLIIALPIGIGAAIFLNEYAKNKRLVSIIEFTIEVLAGIPSIVYGLVGFLIFVQRFTQRPSILAGSLTVAILILPTVVRTTQEALKTVPGVYREGAYAMGATKWHIVRTIVLPCSLDGIVGGIILSMGRIVGESAALLFTAGMGYTLVTNYFSALNTSGGTLTVALFLYATEHANFNVSFAIASVLVFIVLALNLTAKLIKHKLKKI